MHANPEVHEATFWIEEITGMQPARELSGCDLCQHCQLIQVLGRRPAPPPEGAAAAASAREAGAAMTSSPPR
jgi:hypothetical protein